MLGTMGKGKKLKGGSRTAVRDKGPVRITSPTKQYEAPKTAVDILKRAAQRAMYDVPKGTGGPKRE